MKYPDTTSPAELAPVVLDLDTLPELPFEGELETVTCFRCGIPFERAKNPKSAMPPHYWPPTVCSVQPSPRTHIFVCAEKPWVDPTEEQKMRQRIWMHELIWHLWGRKEAARREAAAKLKENQ